jgi:hypothetical protein
MMFRKKKTSQAESGRPVPRGRTPAGKGDATARKSGINPLARRFQADSEPPTVDLAAAPKFQPAHADSNDPKTAPLKSDSTQLSRIISFEPGTGKFYIHPGPEGFPVTLQGESVAAPTELRRGDVIRVGEAEFQFGNPP